MEARARQYRPLSPHRLPPMESPVRAVSVEQAADAGLDLPGQVPVSSQEESKASADVEATPAARTALLTKPGDTAQPPPPKPASTSDMPPSSPPDPLLNPDAAPPISDMTTTQLVVRFNACLEHCGAAANDPVQAECDLLSRVALEHVASFPGVPTKEDLHGLVALAAMRNVDAVRAVLNTLSTHVQDQTAVDPNAVTAIAAAVRLATDLARNGTKYVPQKKRTVRALVAHAANTLVGDMVESAVGTGVAALGDGLAAGAEAAAGFVPEDFRGRAVDAVVGRVEGAVGDAAEGVTDVVDDGRGDDEDAAEIHGNVTDVVLPVATATLGKVAEAFSSGVSGHSTDRHRLLYALCRMLDAVVDIMPATGAGGMMASWQEETLATIGSLLTGSHNAADFYAAQMVAYAKQAVAHVRRDADAEAARLVKPATQLINGVLSAASAAAAWQPVDVVRHLIGIKETFDAVKAASGKPWYHNLRVLLELSPAALFQAIANDGGLKGKPYPPPMTFHVVEKLDAIARQPPTEMAEDAPSNHQTDSMRMLHDVYKGTVAVLEVDDDLRGHVLKRLLRLCQLPHSVLRKAAKRNLEACLAFTPPRPAWRRCLPCGEPAPLADKLEAVASEDVANVIPVASFYRTYDVGVSALYDTAAAAVGTVHAALAEVDPVEAAVEALAKNAARRGDTENLNASTELYVPPLASTQVESKQAGGLDAAMKQWLDTDPGGRCHVKLLHGRSGSGKSLFASLLEQRLFREYKRGVRALVPVFIGLPTVPNPAKAALGEVFAERCGVPARILLEDDSHKWLIIMDSYDEVSGGTNFVRGNKLEEAFPHGALVIVTCRTEFLQRKGLTYSALFTPGDPSATASRLSELYVRPFSPAQAKLYFERWAARHRGGWAPADYLRAIATIPGLKELATSPFLLRALASALPRLPSVNRKLNRADVFEAFMQALFSAAVAKLAISALPDLPKDYDAPVSFANFSKALSLAMLRYGRMAVESTSGQFSLVAPATDPFARFFAPNALATTTLQGCPMKQSGRMVSFMHASVAEFWAASAMFTDAVQLAELVGEGASVGAALRADSPLNAFPLSNHPAVLEFMVDMFRQAPQGNLVAALKAVVLASVENEDVADAASNAASLLAQAGVSLAGVEWEGCLLRKAILRDGFLAGANLKRADLQGASLERATLDGAAMESALLLGTEFGVLPEMRGHSGGVRALGFGSTPVGPRLVSGGQDGTVRLWDVDQGEEARRLAGGGGGGHPIVDVCFSGDGGLVLAAGSNCVWVWPADGDTLEATLQHDNQVTGAAFFSDGTDTFVASVAAGGVTVWDCQRQTRVERYSHPDADAELRRVACRTDGEGLAAVGLSGTVLLQSTTTSEHRVTKLYTGDATSVAFNPSGNLLAVTAGHKVHLLLAADLTTVRVLAHTDNLWSCSWSPDGAMLATGCHDDRAVLWDVSSGSLFEQYQGHVGDVYAAVFTGDGSTVCSAGAEGVMELWQKQPRAAAPDGHTDAVVCVALDAGRTAMASGGVDGKVMVWDALTLTLSATHTFHGPVSHVCFNGDNSLAVAVGHEVHVVRGDAPLRFRTGVQAITSLCVVGEFVVVTGALADGQHATTWYNTVNAASGALEASGACSAVSPTGHLLAVGTVDGTVTVFSVGDWTVTTALGDACGVPVAHVAFSTGTADPKSDVLPLFVAGVRGDHIHVWDVAEEEPKATVVEAPHPVTAFAMAPGAASMAEVAMVTGGPAGEVLIWSVRRGVLGCHDQVKGAPKAVLAAMFKSRTELVTGGDDDSVRVWGKSGGATWGPAALLSASRKLSCVGTTVDGLLTSPQTAIVLKQHGAIGECIHVAPRPAGEPGAGTAGGGTVYNPTTGAMEPEPPKPDVAALVSKLNALRTVLGAPEEVPRLGATTPQQATANIRSQLQVLRHLVLDTAEDGPAVVVEGEAGGAEAQDVEGLRQRLEASEQRRRDMEAALKEAQSDSEQRRLQDSLEAARVQAAKAAREAEDVRKRLEAEEHKQRAMEKALADAQEEAKRLAGELASAEEAGEAAAVAAKEAVRKAEEEAAAAKARAEEDAARMERLRKAEADKRRVASQWQNTVKAAEQERAEADAKRVEDAVAQESAASKVQAVARGHQIRSRMTAALGPKSGGAAAGAGGDDEALSGVSDDSSDSESDEEDTVEQRRERDQRREDRKKRNTSRKKRRVYKEFVLKKSKSTSFAVDPRQQATSDRLSRPKQLASPEAARPQTVGSGGRYRPSTLDRLATPKHVTEKHVGEAFDLPPPMTQWQHKVMEMLEGLERDVTGLQQAVGDGTRVGCPTCASGGLEDMREMLKELLGRKGEA